MDLIALSQNLLHMLPVPVNCSKPVFRISLSYEIRLSNIPNSVSMSDEDKTLNGSRYKANTFVRWEDMLVELHVNDV